METIESFCDRHEACADGKKWALDNCSTMCDVWERAKPEYLVWIATRDGVIDDKTMRLFACWCVRQVWHLLDDERSRNAVVVSEKFANGVATKEELADNIKEKVQQKFEQKKDNTAMLVIIGALFILGVYSIIHKNTTVGAITILLAILLFMA
jgi:hypothetical protein